MFPCAMVSPMFPVPSLLSLLRDCAGQEEPPAQSPFHPNPPQLLLLPWPLGAACGYGDNAWLVPTHPSPVPAGLGTQLALLWQQPEVPECHHLLLHPCPSQCSAASPTAEPSGYQAGWPQGPAVFPVPGSQLRDKGHPVGLSLVLGLDAYPILLLGCPLQLCWTHWCQCRACLGPFPHWTQLSHVCHVCGGGCCAPSLGCTSTSGHGSEAGTVHGVGEHRAGLSPRRAVPTSCCPHVPSKFRSHACLRRCAAPARFVT